MKNHFIQCDLDQACEKSNTEHHWHTHTCSVSAKRTIRFFRSSTRSGLSQYDWGDRGVRVVVRVIKCCHGWHWIKWACISSLVCVKSHRVRPQGSDNFGKCQLPQFLNICSVHQALCGVKDVVLHNKKTGWMEGMERRKAEINNIFSAYAECVVEDTVSLA